MCIERSDSVSYARLLATNVFISEGLDRSLHAGAEHRGAGHRDAGQPGVSDEERGHGAHARRTAVLDAPVTGNWSDGATGVLLQYDEVADSDGHFVIFDREDARQQSTQFLATEASDGVATLVAP